ncbi:hypothetical protein HPB50_014720 [Hyalomma asiaticum]|uniref:Uncharacterized protein n=1 Tax=Hyalomma asiaticum TaxID=266040 RepID=A0ACB7S9H4_HYAAI|nr:hypothetical protein HPB50_014720 [Hyalomma asiaticum]
MRPSYSTDKVLLLRRDRPQSSYTIDTSSWEQERSRFRAFRNNPCVGNRNVTIALVGFVGAIMAVASALAYVHGGGHVVYEPLVNDYDATTAAAAETSMLIAVARGATTSRKPSPSAPPVAAAPFLVSKTPPTRRHHPVARADRRSPRRTQRKKQTRGRGHATPAAGRPRRRQRVTMAGAGRARRTTATEQEETVTTSTEGEQETQQKRLQHQTRTQSPQRHAEDDDDVDVVEDKVAASTPLPKHLVPLHYSVLLHPHHDGSRFVFTGVVKISVKCVESARQIVLHAAGIQVNNAKVSFNAMAANKSAVHDILVRHVEINNSTQQVTLELASFLHPQVAYDISISYVGIVSRWPKGLYKASYKLKNGSEGWMAFTRMKPRYARRVFPCFDEPSFRATFDVEVLRRKDFDSIASMPILKIELSTNHNDYINDVFVRTPPIPTYMLGFAVADFTHTGTGIVKVWSEPSSHTRAEVVLQTANTCLQLYENYFRTRYPFPKLDIIITPAGGEPCEGVGILFLPSSYLARYNLSLDARKQAESNVYRHILKQWIGGIVSFHSWREQWLDAALEAYVLYALARMQNVKSPEDSERLETKMQQMLGLEATQDIPALSRDDSFLDADTSLAVRKGELLLHMFDCAVGSDGIRNALQVNTDSFPGAHVAHAWTHSAGFPLLTITRIYGQGVAVARQERYGQNSSQTVWSIPVTYTDGETMDFDYKGNIFWLKTKEAKLPRAPKDDDWLIANLRGCGYYRVNYDVRNWNLITMELNTYHTNINIINRARIIDDVFELAEQLRVIHYAWACRYKYGPCLIEARHAFEGYKSPESTTKPILQEHQFTVFCTVIEDGDEADWMALRTRLDHVSDGVERRNIILALGCTRDRGRLTRYFEEFSAPATKMVPLLFSEVAKRGSFWRLRTAEYIVANWQDLKETYPRLFQSILTSVFKYACSNEELSEVNNLLKRHHWSLLRYSSTFEKIHQVAKKNMQWVASYHEEVARWLKRDVAEFILDDQVLHGNGTLSGLGNNTKNDEDIDDLDVGASEDFGVRSGSPEYRVADDAITEENSSVSHPHLARLGDTLLNRGRNKPVEGLSGATTMTKDLDYPSGAERHAGSRDASTTAASKGTNRNRNQSNEGSYLGAVHIGQDATKGANESALVEMSLAGKESLLNKDESAESSSEQSYTRQTRQSRASQSVTRNADNTIGSTVASPGHDAGMLAKNTKLHSAISRVPGEAGQNAQGNLYDEEEDYADTTVTVGNFDDIFLTRHFHDGHDSFKLGKDTEPSGNVKGNHGSKHRSMTERAARYFRGKYQDENAVKNGSTRVDFRMAQASSGNMPKKVDHVRISERSRNRSERSKNTAYVRRDVARSQSFAPQMNAAKIAAVKAKSEAFFLKGLEEGLGNTEHYEDYTDTSVIITRFEDIFRTRHYIDPHGTSAAAGNAAMSGRVSGSSGADASSARKTAENDDGTSEDEKSALVLSALESRFDAMKVMEKKLNTENTADKDYTDTTIILENFDGKYFTRHYIDSLGAYLVAGEEGLNGNVSYSISGNVTGRDTSQLFINRRENLKNLFVKDQERRDSIGVQRNHDAESSTRVSVVKATKIRAEKATKDGNNVNKCKECLRFTTIADFSPSLVLLLRGNTSGVRVLPLGKVTPTSSTGSAIAAEKRNAASASVETMHGISEDSVRKRDATTSSALTDQPRLTARTTSISNRYGVIPRAADGSMTSRFITSTDKVGHAQFTPNDGVTGIEDVSNLSPATTNTMRDDTASEMNIPNVATTSIFRKFTAARNSAEAFSSTPGYLASVTKFSETASATRGTTGTADSASRTSAPMTICLDKNAEAHCDYTSTPRQQDNKVDDSIDIYKDSYADSNEPKVDSEYTMREDSAQDDHKKLRKLASE